MNTIDYGYDRMHMIERLRDDALVIQGPERNRIADELERLRATLTVIAKGSENPCAFCYDVAKLAQSALDN